MRRIGVVDDDDDVDMKDKNSDKGNRTTSINISWKAEDSAVTKCCDDPYQRKRKFLDGNVPSCSDSIVTCSTSNLGRPISSKQKFDEFRKDRDLSPEQFQRKNESFKKSQEISLDDIPLDGTYDSLTTPPAIAFVAPPVTNEATIGEYGIDASDQIIVDVLPQFMFLSIQMHCLLSFMILRQYLESPTRSIAVSSLHRL